MVDSMFTSSWKIGLCRDVDTAASIHSPFQHSWSGLRFDCQWNYVNSWHCLFCDMTSKDARELPCRLPHSPLLGKPGVPDGVCRLWLTNQWSLAVLRFIQWIDLSDLDSLSRNLQASLLKNGLISLRTLQNRVIVAHCLHVADRNANLRDCDLIPRSISQLFLLQKGWSHGQKYQ